MKLPIPKDAQGTYPYIATTRSGTREKEEYLDILLLAADKKSYQEKRQKNYYVRIPKSELSKYIR